MTIAFIFIDLQLCHKTDIMLKFIIRFIKIDVLERESLSFRPDLHLAYTHQRKFE